MKTKHLFLAASLLLSSPLLSAATNANCIALFSSSDSFIGSTDAAARYRDLEAEMERQSAVPGVEATIGAKSEAVAKKYGKDQNSLEFLDDAFRRMDDQFMLSQSPSLLGTVESVLALTESGFGRLVEALNTREGMARTQFVNNVVLTSMLFNSNGAKTNELFKLVSDTIAIYKPSSNSNTSALKSRFAQMAFHFSKSAQQLVEIRELAVKAIEKGFNETPNDDSLLLDIMSLHLESGRSFDLLVEDFKNVISLESQLKIYSSTEDVIWVFRLAREKKLSFSEAVKLIEELSNARHEIFVKPSNDGKKYGNDQFSLSDDSDTQLLYAILTYTNLKPKEIVEIAKATLTTAVKSTTDYNGPHRATLALASMLLKARSYTEEIKFIVAQALGR